MKCDDAIRLIGSAVEGQVSPTVLDTLMAHLEPCQSCRHAAETQVEVKRVLASRPHESIPRDLVRRIANALDAATVQPARTLIDWSWWLKLISLVRRKSDRRESKPTSLP
jgi:hypothetical protein